MNALSPRAVSTLERARASSLVEDFARCRVAVIGDVMLDRFLIGRVDRISPEAPVPVLEFEREQHRIGGAANVAHNVATLGGQAHLIGVIGDDADGQQLVTALRNHEIEAAGLITDRRRRTTTKVRIVTTRNQQVARVDYENRGEIAEEVEAALCARLDGIVGQFDVIVVSDYLKGAITRRVMAHVIRAAQARGIPVLVDPKIPHIDFYSGAALVTPNHYEAERATDIVICSHDEARRAAEKFRQRARSEGVLITRGEQGMWLTHDGSEGFLPATAREVADVTGAGDTVIATLALGLAAHATAAEAAWLANEAAGIVVGKFGPATVTGVELLARF